MKKKHPEHVNLERWLVSYADFITLLFAFFVVMYAISQADIDKFKKVAMGIRAAFSAGPSGMIDLGGKSGGNTANPFEVDEPAGGRMVSYPAGKMNTAADPDPELQEIKELLEETVSLELGVTDLSSKLELDFDSRGLVIRLAVKDFFDEGETVPEDDLVPILDRIGRVLAKSSHLVRIEGHSDRFEPEKKDLPSGWELSAARAAWVAKYWMKKFQYEPSKLGIAGYSHYRSLATSSEPASRAKNRRVEIILLNNRYETP